VTNTSERLARLESEVAELWRSVERLGGRYVDNPMRGMLGDMQVTPPPPRPTAEFGDPLPIPPAA
jgi:hypothetical protein